MARNDIHRRGAGPGPHWIAELAQMSPAVSGLVMATGISPCLAGLASLAALTA